MIADRTRNMQRETSEIWNRQLKTENRQTGNWQQGTGNRYLTNIIFFVSTNDPIVIR